MKKGRRLFSLLMIMCLVIGCMSFPSFAAGSGKYLKVRTIQNYADAQKVLKLINKERTKKGLRKLKLDKQLTKAAFQRAAEVSIYIPVTSPHKRADGRDAKAINSRIIYECCAEGYSTPESVVEGWMESPPHRRGILLSNARSIGIGCITTTGDDHVWILEFSSSGVKKKETSKKKSVKSTKKVYVKSSYLKKSYFKIHTDRYDSFDDKDYPLTQGEKSTMQVFYSSKWNFGYWTLLSNSDFKWKSSKPSVATVNSKGIVTPKKPGKTKITAKLKHSPGYKLTLTVTVEEPYIEEEYQPVTTTSTSTDYEVITDGDTTYEYYYEYTEEITE